mmetsp:Transcript_56735/g.182198  ORF Transcript_56735/g.182198 Transcript_56735/m.182198 type:complete len:221 (-) Transcript_56735:85-747(-)
MCIRRLRPPCKAWIQRHFRTIRKRQCECYHDALALRALRSTCYPCRRYGVARHGDRVAADSDLCSNHRHRQFGEDHLHEPGVAAVEYRGYRATASSGAINLFIGDRVHACVRTTGDRRECCELAIEGFGTSGVDYLNNKLTPTSAVGTAGAAIDDLVAVAAPRTAVVDPVVGSTVGLFRNVWTGCSWRGQTTLGRVGILAGAAHNGGGAVGPHGQPARGS